MKRWKYVLIAIGGLGGWAGCSHVATPRGTPVIGTSSSRFLEAPATAGGGPATGAVDAHPAVSYLPPRPAGPLTDPRYPAAARAARLLKATMALRFTVDESGRVTDVRTSPIAVAIPGPFEAEFRAEAEKAMRTWRFTPGERMRIEWIEDAGGAYPQLLGREKIAWDLDVEFAFDPSGRAASRLQEQ